jgi:hypothetical protein
VTERRGRDSRRAEPFERSFELTAKRRWERRRKLLPSLALKYPSNEELRLLSELAKVDDQRRFGGHIRSIVLDAHLNNASFRNVSLPEVKSLLDNVAGQAEQLADNLRELDVDGRGSAHQAGFLLELELSKIDLTNETLLPESVKALQTLAKAANSAASSPRPKRGRTKAALSNPAFDMCVESLWMAAWQHGGNWTVYRSAAGAWVGTMLQALSILKNYLPLNFFPDEGLGRPVEYIRKKLKEHITRNTR